MKASCVSLRTRRQQIGLSKSEMAAYLDMEYEDYVRVEQDTEVYYVFVFNSDNEERCQNTETAERRAKTEC